MDQSRGAYIERQNLSRNPGQETLHAVTKNKITFLINSLGGGGAERVCVNLANGLSARGWHVTLVVLHLNNAENQKDLKHNIDLVLLHKKHARTAPIALAKFLRQRKPEKILVFNHQLAVLLVMLRAILFSRFIIIARNISTLSQKKAVEPSFWHKHVVQSLTRMFYRRVDRVVAQSKGMANDLVCFYGIPAAKISVLPNPVNAAIESYVPSEEVRKNNYLLCVGRLETVKAFDYAIAAFAVIAPEYPRLRLKIVGKGRLEGQLKELARHLGVAERVDFEGYQSNMIPYYMGAKATLLTSLYEGFPNALAESIALGTPVVAFDCPSGPSEIVVDGVNGFLVEHLNGVDLVEKLKQVLSSEWSIDLIKRSALRYSSVEALTAYELELS
jgi:glycosyltransferase involved in cell wall biosynthesis